MTIDNKVRITLRISNIAHEYFRQLSGYQNIMNELVTQYAEEQVNGYGIYKLIGSSKELSDCINKLNNINISDNIEFKKNLDTLGKILDETYPHPYYYCNALHEHRIFISDEREDDNDIAKSIAILFHEGFTINGKKYQLTKFHDEHFNVAIIRMMILLMVLPTFEDIYDIINKFNIDLDWLRDYLFNLTVNFKPIEKPIKLKDNVLFIEYFGDFLTPEATICFSYLMHQYFQKGIDFIQVYDDTLDEINVRVGLKELSDKKFVEIISTDNHKVVRIKIDTLKKLGKDTSGEYVDLLKDIKKQILDNSKRIKNV